MGLWQKRTLPLAGNMLTLLGMATKATWNRRQTVEKCDGEKATL